MNDTRQLLKRISEFRQRIESMPRLVAAMGPTPAEPPVVSPGPARPEPGSRSQSLLEQGLRRISGVSTSIPQALCERSRGLLIEAQGLITRLKLLADDPMLAGSPSGSPMDMADPVTVHFRETAAMAEGVVRYAMSFPDAAEEQERLCEGLEGMIDAARRRFDLLAAALERRRTHASRLDRLASILIDIESGNEPIQPSALEVLAEEILKDESGQPLRLVHAGPGECQAYLGAPTHAAPARFVAAHSLNCAAIAARVVASDADWRPHARDVVLAALIHDVGMLACNLETLARPEPWDADAASSIEAHARAGADRILARLPALSRLASVAASHHERADASGYPGGLQNDQVSPMTRLIAAIDVYAAMCSPRPYRPAKDPREAMTDLLLMGEKGKLDRVAVDKLLCLGLYPAGSIVELSDGSTAMVLSPRDPRHEWRDAARPQIALLADTAGRALPTPRIVNLANEQSRNVTRMLGREDRIRRLGRSYPEWV